MANVSKSPETTAGSHRTLVARLTSSLRRRFSTPLAGAIALACTLVAAVLIAALPAISAYGRGSTCNLLFDGCDGFVYVTMAEDFRQARASGQAPQFFLTDEHTRWVISLLQHSKFAADSWKQVIAPHGFHYFPGSGQVGPQYPPGTGWSLSFFRKVDCIHGLNAAAIIGTSLIGLGLVIFCLWRRLGLSIFMIALVVCGSIDGFFRYEAFSVAAGIVPLMAGTLTGWIAVEWNNRVGSVILGFFSGLMFGLMMQDRVASVLLAPSMAVAFLPRRLGGLAAFSVGAIANGVVPLLRHDRLITGSYFASTYDSGDKQQSFKSFWKNISYYGWDQITCTGLLYLAGLVAALVVLGIAVRRTTTDSSWRQWIWQRGGLLISPMVTMALGIAFFLTHDFAEPYYLSPTVMLAFLLVTLIAISLEAEWQRVAPRAARHPVFTWGVAAVAITAAVVVFVFNQDESFRVLDRLSKPSTQAFARLDLPAPLMAKDAWLWGDRFNGSVRYFDGATGYKPGWASEEVREFLFQAIHDQGYSQFLMEDNDYMKTMEAEARRHGWRLTPVGDVDKLPCFRMEKP